MFRFFGHEACGVLAPQPGIEPAPPALEGEVLTTGLPGMSPVAISSFSKSVSLFQDLILTCLQEPKEVIQRPLEKSPFFSTVSPFLWPLFRQFWSQFLLHYQKKEGHGRGEPFFFGEGLIMCLPLWPAI